MQTFRWICFSFIVLFWFFCLFLLRAPRSWFVLCFIVGSSLFLIISLPVSPKFPCHQTSVRVPQAPSLPSTNKRTMTSSKLFPGWVPLLRLPSRTLQSHLAHRCLPRRHLHLPPNLPNKERTHQGLTTLSLCQSHLHRTHSPLQVHLPMEKRKHIISFLLRKHIQYPATQYSPYLPTAVVATPCSFQSLAPQKQRFCWKKIT